MFQMNWFLNMIKQGYNPEQVMMNVLETQMKGSPMGDNLMKMARNGDSAGIEQFARNFAKERGVDFDTEFAKFRKQLGM